MQMSRPVDQHRQKISLKQTQTGLMASSSSPLWLIRMKAWKIGVYVHIHPSIQDGSLQLLAFNHLSSSCPWILQSPHCFMHRHKHNQQLLQIYDLSSSQPPDPTIFLVAGLDPPVSPVANLQTLWSLQCPSQTCGCSSTWR